jgi:flavodoxin
MKIGIIVHSQTGHTNEVAQKLQEKLQAAGNEVEVEQIRLAGGQQTPDKNSQIENPPDAGKYDAVIFGAPVQAFSLSKVMSMYLEQIPSLQDKKIALFVTKGLRFNWTGGNQAIGKMKKISQAKGGMVYGMDIIVWNKNRDEKIAEVVDKFSGLF